MTDEAGSALALAIRQAIKKVAAPAIIVVGPDEWASLVKLTGALNTIVNAPDGVTMFSLPVYSQRANGWHVMHIPPQQYQSRYGKGDPVGLMEGLTRITTGIQQMPRIIPGEPINRADLIEALQRREHHYRNASEGEYDANLLMKARHMIEHGEA